MSRGAVGLLVALTAGCGGESAGSSDRPTIVVTTNILGQVVGEVVGDLADVEVVMPLGADPHEFAPSARQAEAMASADLLVVNGAGFEEGMGDVIDRAAEADVPTFAAADHVALLEESPGAIDPHLWMDPTQMVAATEALGARLAELDGIDSGALATQVEAYADSLRVLDAEIESTLAGIPAERRVLVTNHEVLGYFADRYDFEVLGAVVPSLTTGAQAAAADLEQLAALIEGAGVRTIFAETTQSAELAAALAAEVGDDVQVVELFTESLDEAGSGAETYVDLMRTNALLVATGLT